MDSWVVITVYGRDNTDNRGWLWLSVVSRVGKLHITLVPLSENILSDVEHCTNFVARDKDKKVRFSTWHLRRTLSVMSILCRQSALLSCINLLRNTDSRSSGRSCSLARPTGRPTPLAVTFCKT